MYLSRPRRAYVSHTRLQTPTIKVTELKIIAVTSALI